MKRALLLALVVVIVFAGLASPVSAKARVAASAYCDIDTLENCRDQVDPAKANFMYDCSGQIHGNITCQQIKNGSVALHYAGVVTDAQTEAKADAYHFLDIPHPNKKCKKAKKRHHHRICKIVRVK